jgi:hypothetical protein
MIFVPLHCGPSSKSSEYSIQNIAFWTPNLNVLVQKYEIFSAQGAEAA